ncbi:hypothetical protein C8Q75DRAFT_741963 [Abortiporus biennis]|nr:hypothetical protein C8Q75DRAFT_741963 [Abortiporus biennis]
MQSPTSSFQFSLPFVLQSASPALASLHATRARLLHHPDLPTDVLASTHCNHCGAYSLDGSGTTRFIRQRRKKGVKLSNSPPLFMQRTCNICGHVEKISLQALPHPPTGKPFITQSDIPQNVSPSPSLCSITTTNTPSVQTSRQNTPTPGVQSSKRNNTSEDVESKARQKKSRGLQDLLARNREREAKIKKTQQAQGLSAFLETL